MRRQVMAAVLGAAATLGFASVASATNGASGVFFVHGTGDHATPSNNHGFQTSNDGAAATYWNQGDLQKYVTSPVDSTQWSYGVAGYQGASQDAMTSWYTVAQQMYDYLTYGNYGAIRNLVVVTHSNGSNPIRYILAHPTWTFTPLAGGAAVPLSTLIAKMNRVIFIAGDNGGTPLADKVTSSGSAANIGNDILSFFGGSSWNNNAVRQQVQATMNTYNGNGTFAIGNAPGGVSTQYLYGTNVYAAVWSGDAWCGGYAQTVGLKAAQMYGWGSSSATTDGFIGTTPYTTNGTSISSKMVGMNGMPGAVGDTRLNHNQSRKSCHGFAPTVANNIHGAPGGNFVAPPPDYTIAPSAQACNATTSGWQSAAPSSGYNYWYGCTSAMHADTALDFDCYVAYGADGSSAAGFNGTPDANGRVVSDGFVSTPSTPSTNNKYANVYNYNNGGAGCSDTWLGDGECDLCLLAKYGYDSASGSAADDDCVAAAAGSSNRCADLAAYNSTGQTLSGATLGYYSYSATH